jgi:hypothetical protein
LRIDQQQFLLELRVLIYTAMRVRMGMLVIVMAEVAVMMTLMRVGVIMVVAVIAVRMDEACRRVMFAPIAPDHPQRDAENERS